MVGEGELTDWIYQGEGGEQGSWGAGELEQEQELEDYYENQKAWPSNYPSHIANRSS